VQRKEESKAQLKGGDHGDRVRTNMNARRNSSNVATSIRNEQVHSCSRQSLVAANSVKNRSAHAFHKRAKNQSEQSTSAAPPVYPRHIRCRAQQGSPFARVSVQISSEAREVADQQSISGPVNRDNER
jgi:hypothetical protein